MKTELYTAVKDALKSAPGIQRVAVWSSNLLKETDVIGSLPMAFLQFSGLKYETMTLNKQECNNPQVIIHLLYKTLDAEDTALFDLSQQIYVAMLASGFNRMSEEPDYSGGEIIDWQITFDCPRIEDNDGQNETISIKKNSVSLELSK